MKRIFFGLFLCCLFACQNEKPVVKVNVGDIIFDEKIDDPNFQLCNENLIKQYYVRYSSDKPSGYKGEKAAIVKLFSENYSFPNMEGEDGYTSSDRHEACKAVPQSIPRASNRNTDLAMKEEWFAMMKGGPAAYSNFEIAGFLAESILLGCIALRSGVGQKLEWDGPNMRATNSPEAARFVKPEPRKGWEI